MISISKCSNFVTDVDGAFADTNATATTQRLCNVLVTSVDDMSTNLGNLPVQTQLELLQPLLHPIVRPGYREKLAYLQETHKLHLRFHNRISRLQRPCNKN